jgi:hypothetical protein
LAPTHKEELYKEREREREIVGEDDVEMQNWRTRRCRHKMYQIVKRNEAKKDV